MRVIKTGHIEINKNIYNEVYRCERCWCVFEATENDAFLLNKDGAWVQYESTFVRCPTPDCDNVYPIEVSAKIFDNLMQKKYPEKQKQKVGWLSWVLGLDQK